MEPLMRCNCDFCRSRRQEETILKRDRQIDELKQREAKILNILQDTSVWSIVKVTQIKELLNICPCCNQVMPK